MCSRPIRLAARPARAIGAEVGTGVGVCNQRLKLAPRPARVIGTRGRRVQPAPEVGAEAGPCDQCLRLAPEAAPATDPSIARAIEIPCARATP